MSASAKLYEGKVQDKGTEENQQIKVDIDYGEGKAPIAVSS